MMRCALVGLAGIAMLLCLGCGGGDEPTLGGGAGGVAPAPGGGAGASALAPEAQRLVGIWKGKEPGGPPSEEGVKVEGAPEAEEMEVSVEFNEDGTAKMDMLFVLSGTWELAKAEGDNLTVKMVLEMLPPEGDDTIKIKAEKMEKDFTIVFETDDRIKMAPTDEPEQALTLDRQ